MECTYKNIKYYAGAFRLLGLAALLLTSCSKSLVDVDNSPSTDFQISLPEDMVTFVKGRGAVDSLIPVIMQPGTPASNIDTSAYTYRWTGLVNGKAISSRPFLVGEDFDKHTPGVFSCLLTMTEKASGIRQSASCDVFVTTATREGWVLLGEKAGAAQLSVLSYTTTGYTKYVDLKAELGIDMPLKGKPYSIAAVGTELARGDGKYQWLGVATDQEIKFIQSMDFTENKKMSDFLTVSLTPNATQSISFDAAGLTTFIATKGTELYFFNTPNIVSYGMQKFDLINKYKALKPDAISFNAAPYHTLTGPRLFDEGNRIMYDKDKYCFVRAQLSLAGQLGLNGLFPLALPFALEGYELRGIVSERGEEQDNITALLYNPTSHEGKVIEFKSNGIVVKTNSIDPVDAALLFKSETIVIDRYNGYVFFIFNNDLYSYDYHNKKGKLMLALGNERISHLKMENYIPLSSKMVGRQDIYKQLLKNLIVCTYDPAKPDNSGTFRSYIVPPGQQNLIMEVEETGFPKIVSTTFATIP